MGSPMWAFISWQAGSRLEGISRCARHMAGAIRLPRSSAPTRRSRRRGAPRRFARCRAASSTPFRMSAPSTIGANSVSNRGGGTMRAVAGRSQGDPMALSVTTASGKASGASSPAAMAAAGPRPSPVELRAMGKRLRETCPRSSHAVGKPGQTRPDPLRLLEASNTGRIPQLIPIRHARMARSPFQRFAAESAEPGGPGPCYGQGRKRGPEYHPGTLKPLIRS